MWFQTWAYKYSLHWLYLLNNDNYYIGQYKEFKSPKYASSLIFASAVLIHRTLLSTSFAPWVSAQRSPGSCCSPLGQRAEKSRTESIFLTADYLIFTFSQYQRYWHSKLGIWIRDCLTKERGYCKMCCKGLSPPYRLPPSSWVTGVSVTLTGLSDILGTDLPAENLFDSKIVFQSHLQELDHKKLTKIC